MMLQMSWSITDKLLVYWQISSKVRDKLVKDLGAKKKRVISRWFTDKHLLVEIKNHKFNLPVTRSHRTKYKDFIINTTIARL